MPSSEPKIDKISHIIKIHNEELIDNYFWIKQNNWKEVILDPKKLDLKIKKYLENENKFKEDQLKDIEHLEQKLFKELKAKIKNKDNSVPKKDGKFVYFFKYNKNSEHPIYYRKNIESNLEEIILDCEKKSKEHSYFNVSSISHSHNHKYLAYNIDISGSEYFSLFIEDTETKKKLSSTINNTTGNIIWSLDNKYIFYVSLNENHRPTKVLKHKIGSNPKTDILIYEEKDPAFFCSIKLSQTKKYLFIRIADHETSEYLIINAESNTTKPVLFKKREKKIEYDLDHHDQFFLISTNINKAKNFKIMISNENTYDRWQDFIPYDKSNLILDFILLKNWLIRLERTEGYENIVVLNLNNKEEYKINFNEQAYHLSLEHGYEYKTDIFRYSYSSPITPKSVFDYNCKSKQQELKKIQEIPSGYNKNNYICKKIFAAAHDDVKIPITILYKKGTQLNSKNYLLLYGYGSYGISIASGFSTNRLALVDRGIIYAIAHIRGGKEKGYEWYENGKLLKKKNTFLDFISCAEKLCNDKYTSPKKIIAQGGSAGGLLMGYIANERPDLFLGIIAQVPFVDICNTMLDEDLPLTVTEIPEWGDIKNDEKSFLYVKSYSPYDNVKKQNYPHMLVTGGISDPRVTYWEMTKWVAKLRENKTDNNLLLLHMNMTAGHSGASGRFDYLKEIAMEYGFVLKICKMLS